MMQERMLGYGRVFIRISILFGVVNSRGVDIARGELKTLGGRRWGGGKRDSGREGQHLQSRTFASRNMETEGTDQSVQPRYVWKK